MTSRKATVCAAACLGLLPLTASTPADELQSLPLPPGSPKPTPTMIRPTPTAVRPTPVPTRRPAPPRPQSIDSAAEIVEIQSAVPFYIDDAITMAPIEPICEFLRVTLTYENGMATMVAPPPAGLGTGEGPMTVKMRVGGLEAEITEGERQRSLRLPLPMEERLGTRFIPLRFVVGQFGGKVIHSEGNAITIESNGRTGVLQPIAGDGYRGGDAARVTIVNRVGRALSLRLSGPQNTAIELGRRQSVTRSLRPGVYNYKAAAVGMKDMAGVRRLLAGRKATWAWGHR